MIVCAGNQEQFKFATPIGVGLIQSAMNLTRLVLFDRPEFLLFIGSCGSYGNRKIFDIVESRGATQIELSFFQNCSYTPLDNAITSEGLEIGHQCMVNSSNYITTCDKFNKNFLSHNIEIENMEFFSLLTIAKEYNIPAGGIFVVTNYISRDAHKEYLTNISKAKEILQSYIMSRFKGIE
jgi:nucleoside phosphorylase